MTARQAGATVDSSALDLCLVARVRAKLYELVASGEVPGVGGERHRGGNGVSGGHVVFVEQVRGVLLSARHMLAEPSGRGGQAGVGGEVAGGREDAAVADDDQMRT